MSSSETAIFPLFFTPFERYLFEDDHPSHPMTIWCRVSLAGQIDRAAFEAAVQAAVARHPLFLARVVGTGRRQRWEQGPDSTVRVDWGDLDEPLAFPASDIRQMDLRRENGLRLWVRYDGANANLFSQHHHLCADGVGIVRFLSDLLADYGARTALGEKRPRGVAVDLKRLRRRDRLPVDPAHRVSFAANLKCFVRESLRLLLGRPRPLAVVAPGHQAPLWDGWPRFEWIELDAEELRRLRSAAQRRGATLNDWLMTAFLVTLHRWNERFGNLRPSDQLRILMPTSLRSHDDVHTPAANMVGYWFLARLAEHCADFDSLLPGIAAETRRTIRYRMGHVFRDVMRWLDLIPFGLRAVARSRGCFATAVFSNLGNLERRSAVRFPHFDGLAQVGNLTMQNMFGAVPVRPGTLATATVFGYAGRMTVVLFTDPHVFSREDARDLIADYRTVLLAAADR